MYHRVYFTDDDDVYLTVLMQNCQVECISAVYHVRLVTRLTELCLQTVVIKSNVTLG